MATATFQTAVGEASHDTPRELTRVSTGNLASTTCFREGLEFLGRGNAELAAACFEQAVAHAPGWANAHVGLGIAYAMLLRIYPSFDHLEKAAHLEPDNFYAHFKLSQLCFKLRIPQKGYEELSRASDCATSLQERKLVAELLKEEKAREKNSVPRPWWNRPYSSSLILFSATLSGAFCVALVFHLL